MPDADEEPKKHALPPGNKGCSICYDDGWDDANAELRPVVDAAREMARAYAAEKAAREMAPAYVDEMGLVLLDAYQRLSAALIDLDDGAESEATP